MLNGLHQLWRQFERDERFQSMDPETRLRFVDHFNSEVKRRFGQVNGHEGFAANVTKRYAKEAGVEIPEPEPEQPQRSVRLQRLNNRQPGLWSTKFGRDVKQAFDERMESLLRNRLTEDDLFDELDFEYEQEVEQGPDQERPGLVSSILGSLAPTVVGSAAAARVAGPIGGRIAAAGLEGFAGNIEGIRDAYYTQLDRGVRPEEARKIAKRIGLASGVIQGVTAGLPAEKLPGVGKLIQKGTANFAGASQGVARFAKETAAKAAFNAIENAAVEIADIAQENIQGVDLSERRGSLFERVAINAAAGAGISSAVSVGAKLKVGNFDAENLAGKLAAVDQWRNQELSRKDIEELAATKWNSPDARKELAVLEGVAEALSPDDAPSFNLRITDEEAPVEGANAVYRKAANEVQTYVDLLEADTPQQMSRILTHEAAHVYHDTLPPEVQTSLYNQFKAEIGQRKGVLFDDEGNLRKGIEDQFEDGLDAYQRATSREEAEAGLTMAYREWFAERMMVSNRKWAAERLDHAEMTGFDRLAQGLRRKVERVGRALGFGNSLEEGFRGLFDGQTKVEDRSGKTVSELIRADVDVVAKERKLPGGGTEPVLKAVENPAQGAQQVVEPTTEPSPIDQRLAQAFRSPANPDQGLATVPEPAGESPVDRLIDDSRTFASPEAEPTPVPAPPEPAVATTPTSPLAPVRVDADQTKGEGIDERVKRELKTIDKRFPKGAKFIKGAVRRAQTHKQLDQILANAEKSQTSKPKETAAEPDDVEPTQISDTELDRALLAHAEKSSPESFEAIRQAIRNEVDPLIAAKEKALGSRTIDEIELFSKRGRLSSDEVKVLSHKEILARNYNKVVSSLNEQGQYKGAASITGRAFEAQTGLEIRVFKSSFSHGQEIGVELHRPETGDDPFSLAKIEAEVDTDGDYPTLYVIISDIFDTGLLRKHLVFKSLQKSGWDIDAAAHKLEEFPESEKLGRDVRRVVEDTIKEFNLRPDQALVTPGTAMYSEMAAVAQVLRIPALTGTVVGGGALGLRRKLFPETTVLNSGEPRPVIDSDIDRLNAEGGLDSTTVIPLSVESRIYQDVLFSRRRGTDLRSRQADLHINNVNGWLLRNGTFIETEPTAAVKFSSEDDVMANLGEHARAGLDWLHANDPNELVTFWSAKEAEAEINDLDAIEVTDSDVYNFLFSRGWARVVGELGDTTYVEGRPTQRQLKHLKDSAAYTGKTLVHDLGGGRERVLHQGEEFFSKRGKKRRNKFKKENPDLPKPETRQFAERAADKFPKELGSIFERRDDIAFKEPQSLKEGRNNAAQKTDDELDRSLDQLEAKVEESDKNFEIMDAMENLRRAMDAKDAPKTEKIYEIMAKAGTTIGQLLRQFREFKGKARRVHLMKLVELALQRAGRKMTATQKANLQKLIDNDLAAKDELEAKAEEYFSDPSNKKKEKAAFDAAYKEDKAFRLMQAHVRARLPRSLKQLPMDFLAAIQGNLLTPVSTGRNLEGNYINYAMRLPARIPAAVLDLVQSWFTSGQTRTVKLPSLKEIGWFAQGTKRGARKAIDALRIGARDDVIIGETIRGFNPVKALRQAFSGDLPVDIETGKVRVSDRLKKLTEAVFGMAPEAMLRTLSSMDELAKEGFRAARLEEETRIRGLKEGTREFAEVKFSGASQPHAGREFVGDRQAQAAAEEAALKQTFQDKSAAAAIAQSIENAMAGVPVVGPGIRIAYRVAVSPYVRTPVNLMIEGMQFAVPMFGVMRGAVKAMQGNRREANLSFGYALTGMALAQIADALIADDLISPGPEDPKTNKMRQDSGMGFFKFNYSGLIRKMRGEDPSYRPDDLTMRLDTLGVMGYVFAVKAEAKAAVDQDPKSVYSIPKNMADSLAATAAAGRFAMNQTMLQGAADGIRALVQGGGSAARWVGNFFNVVTAAAIPNTIVAWNNAEMDNRKETLDKDSPYRTAANVVLDKVNAFQNVVTQNFQPLESLPDKLDLWGRPIRSTPEGQNPYVWHMMDIFKTEKVRNDVSSLLYKIYQETEDPDFIPSVPNRGMEWRGVRLNLPPQEYTSLVKEVQNEKMKVFIKAVQSQSWRTAVQRKPENAAKVLKNLYLRVGRAATQRWQGKNRAKLDKLARELKPKK